MYRIKVHNLLTDQRYEFTAADQAEIDARLERKANVYGRRAWTETIPAWTDTMADPPVEHPEQAIEHPAEHTVEIIDTTPELQKARISEAWQAASSLIEKGFDTYSQISATNLRMDPACPQIRAEKINAVMAWISSVWQHYATVKTMIMAGQDATFDPAVPGDCPYTIWDISE